MSNNYNPRAGFPSLSQKTIALIVTGIVVFILIIVILSSMIFTVKENEQAISLFLGKIETIKTNDGEEVPRIYPAGLHFKLPFGIQKIYKVNTGALFVIEYGYKSNQAGIITTYSSVDYPETSLMLTGDKNIVDVKWSIEYRVIDPVAWLFNVEGVVDDPGSKVRNIDIRIKTINDVAQSVMNRIIGNRRFLFIGNERQEIAGLAMQMMNDQFSEYNLGIILTAVNFYTDILPPELTQKQINDINTLIKLDVEKTLESYNARKAFEEYNIAEQKKETYINEAQGIRNGKVADARGGADKLILEAEAYGIELKNKAIGEAARFLKVYEEYRKAPERTKKLLYIEMFEQVFGKTPSDLIDKYLPSFIPFKDLSEPKSQGDQP